ncbi:MAG: hypothetical protein U5R06_11380 [candidate division KSB1 bacterium]|nr:hypothetical protein [candidate division KSB1 bacterium]
MPDKIVVADPDVCRHSAIKIITTGKAHCTMENRQAAISDLIVLTVHPPNADSDLSECKTVLRYGK